MASAGLLNPASPEPATPGGDATLVEHVLLALVEQGELTPQALSRGRRVAEESGERVDRALNKLGLVSDGALTDVWASATGLPVAAPDDYPEQSLLADTLQAAFLEHVKAIPLSVHDGSLDLAMVDPLDRFTPAAIATKTGLQVTCRLARPGEFEAAFARLYARSESEPTEPDGAALASDAGLVLDVERLRDLASDAPVIRIVNRMIDQAIERGASDVHISATRTGMRVRYRIDGLLRDTEAPAPQLHAAIISRLKIMAGLDIAERRLPQDGRIRIAWRGREIDLRIATMPHLNGEGAVLRILDRSSVRLDFPSLGLSDGIIASLRSILSEPHGIFLVTGPTGSGKTTTLYAALQAIAAPEKNIITVEDPIEYQLDGVNQIQVSRKIGLDFAGALRAVLRQDPDVIMVGEIRDGETAAVANQAALTGHLVLATVHTNTAVAALPRLIDMGVEPYLLASTVKGAMAQRLARRLCAACRERSRIPAWLQDVWGDRLAGPTCFRPVGCEACGGTGYAGRVALAELVPMTDGMRARLLQKADEATLAETARTDSVPPMLDDGLAKIASGLTSVEEILRVIGTG